jgi:hypothetical protein
MPEFPFSAKADISFPTQYLVSIHSFHVSFRSCFTQCRDQTGFKRRTSGSLNTYTHTHTKHSPVDSSAAWTVNLYCDLRDLCQKRDETREGEKTKMTCRGICYHDFEQVDARNCSSIIPTCNATTLCFVAVPACRQRQGRSSSRLSMVYIRNQIIGADGAESADTRAVLLTLKGNARRFVGRRMMRSGRRTGRGCCCLESLFRFLLNVLVSCCLLDGDSLTHPVISTSPAFLLTPPSLPSS